jgi:hypothetical protein
MLRQMEGSRAVAEAVALSRPGVICAHPIAPQAHIVEALGAKVRAGKLRPCEFLNVESEFAAMSVAIGASAAGARAYTATASQGLLYMSEAVYNAAGLGLPIVMTVANRAIGAPINIWNDHSDAMSQRDAGWVQLYAETNQEALDLHIQAFRIAEELSVPVMVCMDGFLLTHAFERADVPTQQQVDAFLPCYEPRQVLDQAEPVSIGAMAGPEAFTEVRYLTHARQSQALELIPQVGAAAAFAHAKAGTEITPGMIPSVSQYAGQQMLTGQQAEAYADHFIAVHIAEMGAGKTYSQLSAESLAQPNNVKLATTVATVFKGETLRSMLLNAFGWWKASQVMYIASLFCWALAGLALIGSGIGFWTRRNSREEHTAPPLAPRTPAYV